MEETVRAKILNVDDNEAGRYSVTRLLKQAGFEVMEAATGAEALKLATKIPDLIVLDVNLPDMKGFEVCRRLKSDPATCAVPVLHLSATYKDSKATVNGLDGGADGYLTQPVEPLVLLAHVKALIRASRMERRLARTNRSLRALSNCNQAVLRAQSEFELIRNVCQVLVEVGGYRFVWVGSGEQDAERSVRPIAQWGEDQGLLDVAKTSWHETGAGCCPMGEAIRSGKPFLLQDIRTDSRCEPWRTEALKRGFVSAFALPLIIGRDVWGAISIHSDTTGIFDDEERELLWELTQDLSYGIESLRTREEARRVHEALRQSEEKLARTLRAAPAGIGVVVNRVIKEVNNYFCEMTGYSREELLDKNSRLVYATEEDFDFVGREIYKQIAQKGKGSVETCWRRKDGEVLNVILSSSAIDQSDMSLGVTFTALDITERKRVEEALRESEERYRVLVENLNDAIFSVNMKGEITYISPAIERMSQYKVGEVVGRPFESFVHPDEVPASMERHQKILEGEMTPYEYRLVDKDGGAIHIRVSSRAVHKSGRTVGLTGVITNITERKRVEDQRDKLRQELFEAQKMEAIGTLAGGVAHDFNNILQVALGYSELMLGDEDVPQNRRADLQKIEESARRGADLVQRLLTFSRKAEINLKPVNLNYRINEMGKMIERTIPKMIDIQLLLAEDLATINADPTQVDQVLMNLAVNARDAMPDGGRLIIETANIILDEEYSGTHLGTKPGLYVLLTITDTGAGMGKDTLGHIFEPFFTTKETGKGTGLGLAVVHGIVQQHQGHIWCYSEPGEGTTFKIYFPALSSEEEPEKTIARAMPQGGTETILLVDDEEFILDLGSRILTKAGYNVITASNGNEALAVYQARSDEIALVILDLIMPEMGGKQCLEGLLNLDPSVKVVIVSGYSANGPTKEALAAGAKGFVNKPYDIRQVLEVVRGVLDAE